MMARANLILERVSRQESNIKDQLEKLEHYFKNLNPLFDKKTFDKDTEMITINLSTKIFEKNQLIVTEEKKINIHKEQFNKNKELILTLERENIEKSAISLHLETESDYQTVLSVLNIFDISYNLNQIVEKENVLKKQVDLIQEKMDKVQLSIQEIQVDEQENDLYGLEVELQNINNEDNNYKEFIDRYLSDFKNYLQSSEVNGNTFTTEIYKLNKEIDFKKNLISSFDILYEKLQYTSEVLENSGKVKEKNTLASEIVKLKQVELQVSESLKAGQKIIIEKIKKAFNLNIINKIYGRIEPHPELNFMEIIPDFFEDKPSLEIYAPMSGERKDNPIIFFSSAQLDILSLSIFFAKALMESEPTLNTIFIDDPVHHMDSVNVLSFIDLLRTITSDFDRQIVITTHNENLFRLIEQKINPSYCNSKFIQLDSHGKVKKF